MVDSSHVLTRLTVLNDFSTVEVAFGKISKSCKAGLITVKLSRLQYAINVLQFVPLSAPVIIPKTASAYKFSSS